MIFFWSSTKCLTILPFTITSWYRAPFDCANIYNNPPRNRNSTKTETSTMARVITFFCESPNFFTLIFFCIISWSRPVMAIVINAPPMICFRKNPLLFTSVLNTCKYPIFFIWVIASPMESCILFKINITQTTRPAIIKEVCRVSVYTIVFTPPPQKYRAESWAI